MGACGHPGSGPRVGWKKFPRRRLRTLIRALVLWLRGVIDNRWKRPRRPWERRKRGLWIYNRRIRRRRRWNAIHQAYERRTGGAPRPAQGGRNELLPCRATHWTVIRPIELAVIRRRDERISGRVQTFEPARRATVRSRTLERRSVLQRTRILQRAIALQRAATLEGTGTRQRASCLDRATTLQGPCVLQRTATLLRGLLGLLGVCGGTAVHSRATGACALHRAGPLHRATSLLTGTGCRLGGILRRLRHLRTNLRGRAHGQEEDRNRRETLRPECNF